MERKSETVLRYLFALFVFFIPFDHKYDKPFRYFSKTIIPEHLNLPSWFEYKISYFTSDALILLLFFATCAFVQIKWKQFFLEKGVFFLWPIPFLSIGSIVLSAFSSYPTPYIRIGHFAIAILLYVIVAMQANANREKMFQSILLALIFSATIQSGIAIAQYFHQESIGLRILGEPFFYQHPKFSSIATTTHTLWFFDRFRNILHENIWIVRPVGTFSHPNILGGFLSISAIATTYAFSTHFGIRRAFFAGACSIQVFAMTATFSRSAFFAFLIGIFLWLGIRFITQGSSQLSSTIALVIAALGISGFLLQDQLVQRGGIVSRSHLSNESNQERMNYHSIAFQMIRESPLLGNGYGLFNVASAKYWNKGNNEHLKQGAVHNIFLLLAAETGLISLGLFLTWIAFLYLKALPMLRDTYTALFGSILLALCFIGGCDLYPLAYQEGRIMVFLFAGLLAACIRDQKRFPNSSGLPSLQGQ